MEEALYLNDSQRAIIAARMANRPGAALKNHLRDASIEASLSIPVPHSHQAGGPLTAARRWRVSTTMPSAEQ